MPVDRRSSPGILYGIGIGPGDPQLISLKGLGLLQKAAVVAFPLGIRGKPGIAQQIIAEWLNPEQIQLPLKFPYVQEQEVLQSAWKTAASQVWQYLNQGKDVAFVSEGDISFYSTFSYLAQTLQQLQPQARVEAIPGICSPLAAAAALGIPLTLGSDRLAILPALYSVAELESVLEWADVVVLLKVRSVYQQVWAILQQCQLLEHSYVVERVTSPDQVIYQNLQEHPELDLSYFSLLIIDAHAPAKYRYLQGG